MFSITATELDSNNLLTSFDSTDLVPCKIKGTSGSNTTDSFPLKVSMSFGYYQFSSTERRMITC